MPIKQPAGGVTGQDFTDALESLRKTVAEAAKATGIPRTYLSDLRNHGTPLRREYAAKLRDWLIGEGIEFDDAALPVPVTPSAPQPGSMSAPLAIEAPHPTLTHALACIFAILPGRPDATVHKVIEEMHATHQRIRELGARKIHAGAIEDADYDADEVAAIQEAFALAAWNYLQFCYLTGFGDFKGGADTVFAVMFGTVREGAERVGIMAADVADDSAPGGDDTKTNKGEGAK